MIVLLLLNAWVLAFLRSLATATMPSNLSGLSIGWNKVSPCPKRAALSLMSAPRISSFALSNNVVPFDCTKSSAVSFPTSLAKL